MHDDNGKSCQQPLGNSSSACIFTFPNHYHLLKFKLNDAMVKRLLLEYTEHLIYFYCIHDHVGVYTYSIQQIRHKVIASN